MDAALFRARRRALDDLIDQVEDLIEHDSRELPDSLRAQVARVLAAIHGQAPPWLEDVRSPIAMLDHLFVAEGSLRREYYADRQIDLDESA